MAKVKFHGEILISTPSTSITVDTFANSLTLNVGGDKWCEVRLNNSQLSRKIMNDIVDDVTHNSNLGECEDGIDIFFGLIAQIKEAIQKKEENKDEYI